MIRPDFNALFTQQLEKLNTAQRLAVDTIEGPVMVIAGPGTGKTQILSARIGNILMETDTRPGNILCLTYTEAGAVAMCRRLTQMIGPDAYRVYIYTFHAFCNDVIQSRPDYFGKSAMEPISDIEKVELLSKLVDDLPVTHLLKKLRGDLYAHVPRLDKLFQLMKQEGWAPGFIKEKAEEYINDLPNREEYIYKRKTKDNNPGDVKAKDVAEEARKMNDLVATAELLPVYQLMMAEKGRYDYEDMLGWVLNAFDKDPYLLGTYQERFQYILVDEFQDTGGVQLGLLYKLLEYWGSKANIFVVGDDDQCIFEFQNARVKNIVDFYTFFTPEIKTIVLTDNYRSSQPILDAAKKVIDNNQQRLVTELTEVTLDKTLNACNPDVREITAKPRVVQYPNPAQEAVDITHQLAELKDKGVSLKETAVIYYKHAQANVLMEVLEKSGIPYHVKRPINLLDDVLINNLLTVLAYLSDEAEEPHSSEGRLFRLLHFNFFNLPVKDVSRIAAFMAGNNRDSKLHWREVLYDEKLLKELGIKEPSLIKHLALLIDEWISGVHNLTLQMLFGKVINQSGLLKWVLKHNKKAYYLEVVRTFYDYLKEENHKNTRLSIKEFLLTIEKMRDHALSLPFSKSYIDQEAVQLLTCHGAKGLEFEYVFMLGCSNSHWNESKGNNFSYKLPDTITYTREESRIESMRRLFYVGMTRAKKQLTISFAETNEKGKDDAPARFIAEFIELNNGGMPEIKTKALDIETMLEYDIQMLSEPTQPVIETFDGDYINKALEGFTMSASHLNKFLRCPLTFYYENVLYIPAARNDSTGFGTAVHEALNAVYTDIQKTKESDLKPKEDMIKTFERKMFGQRDCFTDIQYENRLALGHKILDEYYDYFVKSWSKNVKIEYRIDNIEVNGVPIKGYLDKIDLNDGHEVHVTDYKTGDPVYAPPKLKRVDEMQPGGEYWRQMVFYKILVDNQTAYNWVMKSGEISFIEKDSKKDTFYSHVYEFGADEVAQVKREVSTVHKKIMQHEFTVGCGEKDCEWCAFVKENGLSIM